jgi:hypothetical protein
MYDLSRQMVPNGLISVMPQAWPFIASASSQVLRGGTAKADEVVAAGHTPMLVESADRDPE